MATINLEVVSPDKMVYSGDISMLIFRSTGGELGILPKHAPLVTGIIPHAMRIMDEDGAEHLMAVSGGFVEVTPEKIAVLASAAEAPEEIDINRAEEAYRRAKQRIDAFHQGTTEKESIDVKRAELALQRAKARLLVKGKKME
ncbi:MAG: ATP synthase F1 subunit epsilon [Selenomonadaceae bacterium]|nr:ATP synthase F1 subunit epsilon [Selenomonadaceae bacterium]